MRDINEIYKEWCGTDKHINDCHPVHDSSETIEFAEYYSNEYLKLNTMNNLVDIYNKYGKIPCSKCGIDLLERESCNIICSESECKGIVITKDQLMIFAKEQGKSLKTVL